MTTLALVPLPRLRIDVAVLIVPLGCCPVMPGLGLDRVLRRSPGD